MAARKRPFGKIILAFIVGFFALIGFVFFFISVFSSPNFFSNSKISKTFLVAKANTVLFNTDFIINLDTMQVAWIKPSVETRFGNRRGQYENEKSYNLVFNGGNDAASKERMLQFMVKQSGQSSYLVRPAEDSYAKVNWTYHTFEYYDTGFLAGRIESTQPITPEEADKFIQENY